MLHKSDGFGQQFVISVMLFAALLGAGWLMNKVNRGTQANVVLPFCGESAVSSPLGQSMTNFRFPDCTVTRTDYGFPFVSKSVYVVTDIPKTGLAAAREGDTIVHEKFRSKYREIINPITVLIAGYGVYWVARYVLRRRGNNH